MSKETLVWPFPLLAQPLADAIEKVPEIRAKLPEW